MLVKKRVSTRGPVSRDFISRQRERVLEWRFSSDLEPADGRERSPRWERGVDRKSIVRTWKEVSIWLLGKEADRAKEVLKKKNLGTEN